jgi:hypothetical protein
MNIFGGRQQKTWIFLFGATVLFRAAVIFLWHDTGFQPFVLSDK